MGIQRLKGLFPVALKDLVKCYPILANPIDSILNGRREINVYTGIPNLVSPDGREYLFRMARSNSPELAIVEIGCYAGGSTYFLGKGAKLSGSNVYSIDPFSQDLGRQIEEGDGSEYMGKIQKKPSKAQVQKNMRDQGLEHVVTLIGGFSTEIALKWNIPIGVLFIDGNHQQAYEDYKAWSKHLADAATVIFDDADFPQNGRKEVKDAIKRIMHEENLMFLGSIGGLVSFKKRRQA